MLPGNSQQPVPYQAPRDGLHPWAAGHTDPHSSLGVAALMGIRGAKAAIETHGLSGALRPFGGERWVAPLLPVDFPPPVDLRWPEYVETPRGREWWIPTPSA